VKTSEIIDAMERGAHAQIDAMLQAGRITAEEAAGMRRAVTDGLDESRRKVNDIVEGN